MDYTENKPNVSANSIERRKRNDTLELFLRKKRSFRESCFVYKKKEKKENACIRKQLNISVLLRSKMGKKRIIHSLQYNWCRENGGCEEIVPSRHNQRKSYNIYSNSRDFDFDRVLRIRSICDSSDANVNSRLDIASSRKVNSSSLSYTFVRSIVKRPEGKERSSNVSFRRYVERTRSSGYKSFNMHLAKKHNTELRTEIESRLIWTEYKNNNRKSIESNESQICKELV